MFMIFCFFSSFLKFAIIKRHFSQKIENIFPEECVILTMQGCKKYSYHASYELELVAHKNEVTSEMSCKREKADGHQY